MTEVRVVAEGLRFPEGPVAMPDGSVLLVEMEARSLSRVDPSGSVKRVAGCGGGPNGAALGPDGKVYVCNNGGSFSFVDLGEMLFTEMKTPETWQGGSIQRVDPETGEVETLYTHCDGHPLRAPNDLVFDSGGGMWFTDFGAHFERQHDKGGIYYARPDGSEIREVVYGLHTPNGIGLSPDGSRLYAAETTTARVFWWEVAGPGELAGANLALEHGGNLLRGFGDMRFFDSLAVDREGWICVATILRGGITAISPDGQHAEHIPLEDPIVTNICFGGEDLRTAYVTLSATGKLVRLEWPRPGLRLAF